MKNIIICSDGTWQSPESDTSTYVLRLAEGTAPGREKAGSFRNNYAVADVSRIHFHRPRRHAVAIDEMRQDFEPTLWSTKSEIEVQEPGFA